MRIQLLGLGHQLHGAANVADAFLRQVLERNLAAVRVQVHTVVCRGIAVRRQRVVGAAGIVAGTLAGVGTQEHAARIDHALSQLLVVLRLNHQVLGSIQVRQVHHLLGRVHQHVAAVLQCTGGNLLARQQRQLAVQLGMHLVQLPLAGGDEQHLRVDAVLGL